MISVMPQSRPTNGKYSQPDLLLGIVNRVRAMADIATDSKCKVATNSTFLGVQRKAYARV